MTRKENKWEELGSCMSRDAEITIREAAERKNDEVLLLNLGRYKYGDGQDLVAKEAKIHHYWRRDYLKDSSRIYKGDDEKKHNALRNYFFHAVMK